MSNKNGGLRIVKVDNVTIDELKKKFPRKRNTITEDTVDLINQSINNPEFHGYSLLDTMYTYQNVMENNNSSIEEYLNAIKFCAYLESTDDNFREAYVKVFMNREFVQDRINEPSNTIKYKELSSAASRYRRSPLVISILTQADVPLYLMFQGFRYKAVSVLAEEMYSANFSKDRISAAKALLENVKPPENIKLEMDIGFKENNAIQDLNDQLTEIANRQLNALDNGIVDINTIGSMKPKEDNNE